MALGVVLSIALMALDYRFGQLERLRGGLLLLLSPVQYAVDWPLAGLQWFGNTLASRSALLEENRQLRQQQTLLQSRSIKYVALQAENKRLRELLDSSERVDKPVVIAEILRIETNPLKRQIVINKGSRDRAFTGQTVIDTLGVVGQITHTGPYTANVILITDPNHSIPVQIARNGVRAIAVGGKGDYSLELPYLAANADVEVGDILIASGLGGRFPDGYPVATVTHIDRNDNVGFTSATAAAAARLDRHREVLLIRPAAARREVGPGVGPEMAPQISADARADTIARGRAEAE